MKQIKEGLKIFFIAFLGFLIFAILLFCLNILTNYFENNILNEVVNFLNNNFWTIVFFSIILTFGDIFNILIFPYNLPAPLLNATGSIFLIRFLFNMFNFVTSILGILININLEKTYILVVIIVFLIILIVGYIGIFLKISKRSSEKKKR
jgi:hypothetical protein